MTGSGQMAASRREPEVACFSARDPFGVETSMTISARSRSSLAFSASRALRRRASDTYIPPHVDRHMQPGVPETPIRAGRSFPPGARW